MAAGLISRYYGASATEPAGADATTGIQFNREDTQAGTAASIPLPQTGLGTFFSWHKQVALAVAVTDPVTHITNRTIRFGTNVSLPVGIAVYYLSTTVYRQASAANTPANATGNGAVPVDPNSDGTYILLTTTPAIYDAASVASAASGRNGRFARLVFGVDARYTGGAGTLTLPNIIMGFDEV